MFKKTPIFVSSSQKMPENRAEVGQIFKTSSNFSLFHQSPRPYFLWVLLLDTHIPYIPSKRKWSNLFNNYFVNYKLHKNKWHSKLDANDQYKLMNAYDDCILYADEFVRRLIEETEKDNPIFIIHADHGDAFGEHGFYHHPPLLYEELIHVPLLLYNAGIKGMIKKPVSLLNLAPTIVELIGEENEFSSESFLSQKDFVISKRFDKGKRKTALRMENWKYIERQEKGEKLFNLKEDPSEQKNLAEDLPDVVEAFKMIVKSHVREKKENRRIKNKVRSIKNKRAKSGFKAI